MIFLTTTSIDVDIELANRCTVLTVNEEREQTDAIYKQQRRDETWEGLQANLRRANVRKLHHNAQRLIRPLDVVNPFAEELRFMDSQTRFRRDHKKYLTLIRSVALLHQYQREIFVREIEGQRREVIEVTADDIALANRLADAVLGKSIDDLPGQSRRLLKATVRHGGNGSRRESHSAKRSSLHTPPDSRKAWLERNATGHSLGSAK